MNSTSFSAVAIGLKGAGKTTFLAALWNLLEEGTSPSCAKLAALQPDREYLQAIRGNWLDLNSAQRTSAAVVQHVALALKIEGREEVVELNVPDLSGETFSAQWETRRTTNSYATLAAGAKGLLLFINPQTLSPRPRIGPVPIDGVETAGEPWSVHLASTQVQLVDCLQFVSQLQGSKKNIRVAVVVSAWDVIGGGFRPRDWVERRLPLLHQFLETHGDGFVAEYFGVSAQGGRWPEDKARLQDETPSRRPVAPPVVETPV